MKELTTPKAILIGFFMVAVSIASLPYEGFLVKPAHAMAGRYAAETVTALNEIVNRLDSIAEAIRSK